MGKLSTRAGSAELSVPKKTILTILGIIIILAYILFPIDLIPDIIPIWGWIDDLVVTLLVGAFVADQWK